MVGSADVSGCIHTLWSKGATEAGTILRPERGPRLTSRPPDGARFRRLGHLGERALSPGRESGTTRYFARR